MHRIEPNDGETLKMENEEMYISIVLPCLNESETLLKVIKKCFYSLEVGNYSGEVIVADNGSTDGSIEIAKNSGAVLVEVAEKGYGSALRAGISASKGKFVVMGDSDDSYSLDDLDPFIAKLESGFDLVVGNRFQGGIEKGAMPWLHKYLGNPVLTYIGKILYKVPINDFHCGLRAFRREPFMKLHLSCPGMEFASEMIVKSSLHNLKIAEVPTKLRKDGRSRPPHLNTWRDGWRHLVFLLLASPNWLFVRPAIFLFTLGTSNLLFSFLSQTPKTEVIQSNLLFFYLGLVFILIATQCGIFALLARLFAKKHEFIPSPQATTVVERIFTIGRGIFVGIFMIVISIALSAFCFVSSKNSTLQLSESTIRISGLLALSFCVGIQVVSSSFFAAILRLD